MRRRIQRLGPKGTRPAYHPEVFRSRYLQLTREDRLTGDARRRLEAVLAGQPELAHAWELYQALCRIYTAVDDTEANQALAAFVDAHHTRTLPEFESLVDTLLEWGDEIFAFHDTGRATNGRLEGINNKLGVLKRIAYGFTNADNFAARALLLCPPVPSSP